MYYSINQLNISEKSKNTLRKFNVGSITDLKNFSIDDFSSVKGVREGIIIEIKDCYDDLKAVNFNTLKMNLKEDFFDDRELSKSAFNYLDSLNIHTENDMLNHELSDFVDKTTFQIQSKNKIRILYVITYVTNSFHVNNNEFLNILSNHSIHNLKLDADALDKIKKMGIRSIDELYCVAKSGVLKLERNSEDLITHIQEKIDEWLKQNSIVEEKIHYNNAPLIKMYMDNHLIKSDILSKEVTSVLAEYPIEILNLPLRIRNPLRRNHIDTLLDLFDIQNDSSSYKLIGKKAIAEVENRLNEWMTNNNIVLELEESKNSQELQEYKQIQNLFENYFFVSCNEIKMICSNYSLNIPEVLDDAFVLDFINTSEMHAKFKRWFLKTYENGIVSKINFENYVLGMPFLDEKEMLMSFFKNTLIDELDSNYILKELSFSEFITQHKDDSNQYKILYMRTVEDMNLQQIGDLENITKERVRQILSKLLNEIPRVREDIYREVFEHFKINKETFLNIFPKESEATYNYLSLKYYKGKIELNYENLKKYNDVFIEDIQNYFSNEEKKKLSRLSILNLMLKQRKTYFSLDTLLEEYNQYLKENGYSKDKEFEYMNTVVNHLRTGENIVFNHENKVRYLEADYKTVTETLDLSIYHDSVISADLIYKDNIDLMPDFGIKDGYELFYVLKYAKSIHLLDKYDIDFRRVPIMVFDGVTEEAQMVKLLEEISPISLNDYFEIFEERYGVNKASAKSNFSKYITKYLENGILKINVPTITEEDVETFKNALSCKELWFIDEMKTVLKEKCQNSDPRALNVGALERIGYHFHPLGYAFPLKYKNMIDFLNEVIFSKDIINLRNFSSNFRKLAIFVTCFNKKKSNFEYIEVEDGIFLSDERFEKEFGYNKEQIFAIQNELLIYCKEDYFNAKTILPLLKESAVLTPDVIQILNTNPWLTTCLIRQKENVFTLPYATTKLLSFDKTLLETSLVCKWIADREGKMTVSEMKQRLDDIFGIEMTEYNITRILLSKNMLEEVIEF